MDSSSESWRRECEARAVLAMPDHWQVKYMLMVEQKRGRAASVQLMDDIAKERR